MGGIDKLLEPVGGKPVLQWSVDAMRQASAIAGITVVARLDRIDEFARLEWLNGVTVVPGGAQRSDSVRAGVEHSTAEVVLVHDGARPLASTSLIDKVARAAADRGAAVPVVPVVDSLKKAADNRLTASVDRDGLVRAQTPQGARRDLLLDAFAKSAGATYTDEAALLAAAGIAVATVPGEATNIKITDRDDLEIVRAIAHGRSETRFGFGEDSHGFGPDDGLMLGGIEIADAPRLYGHSDGDVVLHALSTALISACGQGDLGRLYPASDASTTGISSVVMLETAVRQAADAGWSVERAQVSIVGARPRVGGQRLDAMRHVIAATLGTAPEAVSVVASTGNLAGPEGAGRVISARAFVTVHRR